MELAIVFLALCTITDCAFMRIGRGLLFAGCVAGITAAACLAARGNIQWYHILISLLPGGLLLGLGFLTEGKVGSGDGYMALILGLMLGWETCLFILCLACLMAALYAGAGLVLGRLGKKSRLPFAPFLLAGSVCLWLINLFRAGGW